MRCRGAVHADDVDVDGAREVGSAVRDERVPALRAELDVVDAGVVPVHGAAVDGVGDHQVRVGAVGEGGVCVLHITVQSIMRRIIMVVM